MASEHWAEVERLLTASRAAHDRKKRAAGTIDRDGNVASAPNYPLAESHLAEAKRLRVAAHDLDPDHEAPAWEADLAFHRGVTHDTLLDFFTRYESIP